MKGLSEFCNTAKFQIYWVAGAKVIILTMIWWYSFWAILTLQITPLKRHWKEIITFAHGVLQLCFIAQKKGLSEFYNTVKFQIYWGSWAEVMFFSVIKNIHLGSLVTYEHLHTKWMEK